ncbi:MAG: ankyrin repeat domain-containing protein [Candidatus Electrothrix aestuarii]|uniref:Ankyrin repeat domain-containing protein n=1 Tax=Candidatus Electrothrix aestuarii TaxID=3062594 RepID=A0AAU8LQH7_9BACT|nr:ankyrin repeat domain-containing protein [Candidatus Electrothrix aestuarii]
MNKYILSAILLLCLTSFFSNSSASDTKPEGEIKSLFALLYNLESREEQSSLFKTYLDFLQSAKSGDIEAVKKHLDSNIRLNASIPISNGPIFSGVTMPFHYDYPMSPVRSRGLLDYFQKVDPKYDFDEFTALIMAAQEGHTEIIKLLRQHGASLNTTKIYHRLPYPKKPYYEFAGETALTVAAAYGHFETVKYLIKEGAEINPKEGFAETPLMWAVFNGHYDIVDLLIKKGAKIDSLPRIYCKKQINTDKSHYHIADPLTEKETLKFCIDFYGPLQGEPALILAAQRGHTDLVKLLIENKANINIKNLYSYTPLIAAAENGHHDIIQLLLEAGADINAINVEGNSALIKSTENGDTESVKLLIDHGADPNIRNKVIKMPTKIKGITTTRRNQRKIGHSALTVAATKGYLDLVEILLDHGADINNGNISKKESYNFSMSDYTALTWAVRFGQPEVTKLLIERGADMSMKAKSTNFLLFRLIYNWGETHNGHRKVAKILLDNGALVADEDQYMFQKKLGMLPVLSIASLDALDPACEGEDSQKNCNGKYLENATFDTTSDSIYLSETNLFNFSVHRKGVVTDGVTRLLLRAKSSGPVTFTIKNASSCELGELSSYNGQTPGSPDFQPASMNISNNLSDSTPASSCQKTITIHESHQYGNGDNYVFALYKAPLNFPAGSDATEITKKTAIIEATDSAGNSVIKELELVPPPVVLIHGLWSDKETWSRKVCSSSLATEIPSNLYLTDYDNMSCWDEGLDASLKEKGFKTYLVDYSEHSAATFNPQSNSYPINQLVNKTNDALLDHRKKGIAASQVDVVGHSMGGLITRARTVWMGDKYKRKDNYNKGDFHKIITIGTPHQGSPFGNVLAECKDVKKMYMRCEPDRDCYTKCNESPGPVLRCKEKCKSFCKRYGVGISLKEWMSARKKPIDQGVEDLQIVSEAIANIPLTDVPSHAVIGIASDNSIFELGFNIAFQLDFLLGKFDIRLKDNNEKISVDRLLGKEHDTIVTAKSQRGGLSGQKTSVVKGVVHAPLPVIEDSGETTSKKVSKNIINLLLKNKLVTSLRGEENKQWGFFTATSANNEQTEYTDCKSPAKTDTKGYILGTSIKFVPLAGTVIRPGGNVDIKFDIQGEDEQKAAFFQIDNKVIQVKGEPPYVANYKIPPYKAGKINIYVDTIGSDKESYSFSSHILVVPEGSPDSISSSQEDILLSQVGSTYQLEVIGKYPNGSEFNIAEGELGTTYATESGTEDIITVSSDGLIEAKGKGLDSVLITNSGHSFKVSVQVDPILTIEQAKQLYKDGNGQAYVMSIDQTFAKTMKDKNTAGSDQGNEAAVNGKQVFQGCKGCHAYQGQGGTIGPDLTNVAEKYQNKRGELMEFIRQPPSPANMVMTPFSGSESELEALTDYLLEN